MRAPLFLAAGLVTEVGFLGGVMHALSLSNIPHTPEELGRAFGLAVLFLLSQLFQMWARKAGHRHLARGLQGLARAVRRVRARRPRKFSKSARNAV